MASGRDEAKDHYRALGVRRDESGRGIRKAFRRQARSCHPDCAGQEGAERFREIAEAYDVLSDPEARAEHDRELARGARGGAPAPRARPWPAGSGARARPWPRRPSEPLRPEPRGRAEPLRPPRAAARPELDRVDLDLRLTRSEAAYGGLLPLRLRVAATCPECDGAGWAFPLPCPICRGEGAVVRALATAIRLPPGLWQGAVLEASPFGLAGPTVRLRVTVS